ncbi:MAG: ATP-binding cassette domain-containing protein [Leptospirales bacterium]|nr:ATP-binding cassette domain-containing protein [Leptospirales bacterium]
MIKLENVSLDIFGSSRRILSSIDWEIKSGENWILFGRNGSGKTKLLEIITGYIFPSEGSVTRFGCGHLESDIREIRKRIGYLSSILREKFDRNEKVIDTLLSGIYASVGLYREPSMDEIKRAENLICEIGLAGRVYDTIGRLSDGEKQKLFMIRALINNPDILILDEPAAGLDICAREDFLESLKRLTAGRTHSLIYVTHHVEEIIQIFSKIFIIDEGRCFFNGRVDDAINKNIFRSLFKRDIEIFKKGERLYSSLGSS